MKKFDQYKDSGIEWIGNIPRDWRIRKIKYNTYVKARVGWHGLKSDEFSSEGVYCVTGTDFKNGRVNWKSCYKVSEDRYNEDPYIQLNENDLLITKDGTIGKIALVKGLHGKATLNSGVFVVRVLNNEYLTDYMYWVLQTPVFSEFVNSTSKGSTIIHLYQDTFINLPFILPSIKEQASIVGFLQQKCHDIDIGISKKKQLINLLNEEKAAIINQAVTKGIDADAAMKLSGIEWLGDIPAHWEIKKLKYLAKNVQTGSTPPSGMDEYTVDGSFDWFTPADFKDDIILKDSKRKVTQKAVDDGAVKVFPPLTVLLVGIGATLGKIGLAEMHCSSNQQINSIQFHDAYNPYFGAFFLRSISEIIGSFANAATLAILNQSQTKDLLMVCPPVKEQSAIVDFIAFKSFEVNKAIVRIEKEIELLQEYKTSLIYEVVTGKLKIDALVEEPLEASL